MSGSKSKQSRVNLSDYFPTPTLCLKIDVDTYEGLKKGVPRLLRLFDDLKIRTSFFVAMGPDHSGRAIWRLFRQKGFFQKMWRTKAPRLYGIKTMLYGTFLPGPLIGKGEPSLLRAILERGHELGIHGYDHVYWHDKLLSLPLPKVKKEWLQAVYAFRETIGCLPLASAAPGWQCSLASLKTQDSLPLIYRSDTRGRSPYFPFLGHYKSQTLEIPTTLPTLDELAGTKPEDQLQKELTQKVSSASFSLFTAHTEVEGGIYFPFFKRWLTELKQMKLHFATGRECAEKLLKERSAIPYTSFFQGSLPGRAGTVTIQK